MRRVSTETMTVGILSLLFALIGAYMLREYLAQDVKTAAPRKSRVPLAANDLTAGKRIALGDILLIGMTDQDMRDRQYDMDYLMMEPRQIVGRILRDPINQGDPFYLNRLYPVGEQPNMMDRLKPGYRAVTIRVSETGAVGGYTGDGSFVDVLFMPDPNDKGIPRRLYTILHGVEVLEVASDSGAIRGGQTVTLAVTAEDAMNLRIIEEGGDLSLMLRNPDEPLVNSLKEGRTFREALGFNEPEKEVEMSFSEWRTQIVKNLQPAGENVYRFPTSSGQSVEDQLPVLKEEAPELPEKFHQRPPARRNYEFEYPADADRTFVQYLRDEGISSGSGSITAEAPNGSRNGTRSAKEETPGRPRSAQEEFPGRPRSAQEEFPGQPRSAEEEYPGRPRSAEENFPGRPRSAKEEDPSRSRAYNDIPYRPRTARTPGLLPSFDVDEAIEPGAEDPNRREHRILNPTNELLEQVLPKGDTALMPNRSVEIPRRQVPMRVE